MKKLLFIFTVIALFVAIVTPTFALAQTETKDDYKNSDTYKILNDFVTYNPNRSGEENEKLAAEYVGVQFAKMGYTPLLQKVPYAYANYITYNTIIVKDNKSTDECIVIGAHYDCIGEQGASDNASGITALLLIAQKLKEVELPFDVYFVAFGGEELHGEKQYPFVGSSYFVDTFATTFTLPLAKIRVMFNLDSIASGDNLYIHCENKSTDLADLILQNKQGSSEILKKPYAVGTYYYDAWGYGYYERVQGSDHTPFRLANVPVANFFSGNFKLWDYVESADSSKAVMNTSNDTVDKLNQHRGAGWVAKIDTVVDTVVATISCQQFDAVSKTARNDIVNNNLWYNTLWPSIVALVIGVVLVVLAICHYRKLQKQAILGTAEVKNNHVFESPDADDIFSFKD